MHMVTLQGNQPMLSLNVVMKEMVQFSDWTVIDMTATGSDGSEMVQCGYESDGSLFRLDGH